MKGKLALAVGFALLIAVVAWAQEKIELNTIGGPDTTGQEAREILRFMEKYPNVTINVTSIPYGRDQRTKLVASFAAGGSAYDFYVIDCVEVPEYAEAGWALDVTDWVTPEMKRDVLPFALEGMAYKDRWYGLPWISEWKSFVYNAEMFKKVGYEKSPATWDEYVKLSQKLQKAGVVKKYATAWSWIQKEAVICDFAALTASFGGEFFDKDNNPLFNKGGAVKALQFMVDTIYKYKITNPASTTYTETDVDNAMRAGDIAYEYRWGLPLVPLNNPEISKIVGQARIALAPSYDGKHSAACSGPMGWSISPGSKNKEWAWKYILFRADMEGAKRNAIEAGVFPGWAPLYSDPEVIKAVPGIDLMLEQGKHIVNRPRVPWYYEFSAALQVEILNALVRKKTPQQALNDAYKKTLEIKAKAEKK
ncbi:MAG: extracellular solute-binding protein [bacterium]